MTCLRSPSSALLEVRISRQGGVLCAHELGLVPITTPAYSSESNGLAEAFVHTFKRDYVNGAELAMRKSSLRSSASGSRTTTRQAPHSALGMRPAHRIPGGARTHAPICLAKRGADHRTLSHASEPRKGMISNDDDR